MSNQDPSGGWHDAWRAPLATVIGGGQYQWGRVSTFDIHSLVMSNIET